MWLIPDCQVEIAQLGLSARSKALFGQNACSTLVVPSGSEPSSPHLCEIIVVRSFLQHLLALPMSVGLGGNGLYPYRVAD